MAFNREKFKSLVHYVCWRCKDDPTKLGAVKLNKVLWISDFTSYYKSGEAITGAGYVKRQHGPVPRVILPVLHELETERALVVRDTRFHGFLKKEFIALREPDVSDFQPEELEIIDWAIKLVCEEHTAKSISERSHDHIWKVAEDGEEIPYYTIFAVPGEITEDEREWAKQELESMQEEL
jgi:antitoxin SocA-like protein